MVVYKRGDQVIATSVKRIGHRIKIGSVCTIVDAYGNTRDDLYVVRGPNKEGVIIGQVLSGEDFKPAPRPLESNEEALKLLEGEVPW